MQESSWCIARETSESTYIWDSEGPGSCRLSMTRIVSIRIKVNKAYITHTHTHTLASGGVEVWPATACGWEQPMCSPGADSGLCYLKGPRIPKLRTAERCHLGRLPSQSEGRKSKEEIPTGVSGINSAGKSAGQARNQVDWCCNCTWHSTCSTLSPSAGA